MERVPPARHPADPQPDGTSDDPVRRGAYLAALGGCVGCHTDTDGVVLAGGYPIATPFGVMYGTNLTPDPATGIGGWSLEDFVRAMREGRAPDGSPYYPVFPYPSFTTLADRDLADLWAWLQAQAPVERRDRPHDLRFPASVRSALVLWQALELGPAHAGDDRGEYLVRGILHCGECHTPRDPIGGMREHDWLAGTDALPEPGPDVRPAALAEWSEYDLHVFLQDGTEPDGDATGEGMKYVVRDRTRRLSEADRAAVVAYLKRPGAAGAGSTGL